MLRIYRLTGGIPSTIFPSVKLMSHFSDSIQTKKYFSFQKSTLHIRDHLSWPRKWPTYTFPVFTTATDLSMVSYTYISAFGDT